MPLLQVQNLSYRFPGESKPVWQDVAFSVQPGELVLLAGRCGSGKSTLLKCLSGIIPHLLKGNLQGQIYLKGKSMMQERPSDMIQQIGVVWQNVEAQILHQYVEDELVFTLENLAFSIPEINKRLSAILPLVRLEKERAVSTLSGGQRQRLVIGSVLAAGPPLLLLDEPLANLDPPSCRRFLQFLGTLCRRGTAVIVAEHRLEAVAPFAQQLILLKDQKAVQPAQDTWKKEQGLDNNSAPKTNQCGRRKPALLSLKGLHIAYRRQTVIQNLDLSVGRGEHVVLLGNNGSGKSTLLKTLCGAGGDYRATFSSFDINGRKIKRLPAALSRETGLVMQNPHHQLFMDSVYKEISFGACDQQSVDEILQLFDLKDLAHRHPFSLSQGQKRLLALAAALSHRPCLLLLDEPTIGQDHKSLLRMIEVLQYISKKWGTAMITATHDQQAARNLAHRVVLLKEKQAARQGGHALIASYFADHG